MRISDWSSDVCSSDLDRVSEPGPEAECRRDHRLHLVRILCRADPGRGGTEDADRLRDLRHAAHLRGRVAPVHLPHHEPCVLGRGRSEEHTSELQSLMRISYAVFCLKKKKKKHTKRSNK